MFARDHSLGISHLSIGCWKRWANTWPNSVPNKVELIFLKFHCILYFYDFTVTNRVIIKDSMYAEISLLYKENNKGTRTVPCGTPDTTGAESDLTPFTGYHPLLSKAKKSVYQFIPSGENSGILPMSS